MNRSTASAIVGAMAAFGMSFDFGRDDRRGGEPVSYRPGQKVWGAPPVEEEILAYVGSAWRHRITGQVRDVFAVDAERGEVVWGQRTGRVSPNHGIGLRPATIRKALQWLRNAEAVQP